MHSLTSELLLFVLGILLLMSAFFSSAETGLISLDRYRLLSRARAGHRGARRVRKLLRRKDRLLGLILVGNNVANIGASVIATVLSLRLLGNSGPAVAAAVLTLYMLIFSEIAPKTLAVMYPERIAYPASLVLLPLSWLFSPLIKLLNYISNLILRPLGVNPAQTQNEPKLDRGALLSILSEKNSSMPKQYQDLLINVLNLDKAMVNDIMIPRMEITSIDINGDPQTLKSALLKSRHDYMTVYQHDPDDIIGILGMRAVAKLTSSKITPKQIRTQLQEPLFVPEHTPLMRQFSQLQREERDVALVTDEYGIVQGMINIHLIWQEIVGKVHIASNGDGIYPQKDGSVIVDATVTLRTINHRLKWNVPTDSDVTTLNGLLLDRLRQLPAPQLSIRVGNYAITIKRLGKNGLVERALIEQIPEPETPQPASAKGAGKPKSKRS